MDCTAPSIYGCSIINVLLGVRDPYRAILEYIVGLMKTMHVHFSPQLCKSALEVSSEEPLCLVCRCCDGVTMAVTAAFLVVGDAEVLLIADVTMMSVCLWRLYSK